MDRALAMSFIFCHLLFSAASAAAEADPLAEEGPPIGSSYTEERERAYDPPLEEEQGLAEEEEIYERGRLDEEAIIEDGMSATEAEEAEEDAFDSIYGTEGGPAYESPMEGEEEIE